MWQQHNSYKLKLKKRNQLKIINTSLVSRNVRDIVQTKEGQSVGYFIKNYLKKIYEIIFPKIFLQKKGEKNPNFE